MPESASDRLLRLLGMVAYLQRSGPVPLADLAAQFGVSTAQALRDIDTLWVSGTPGYLPGDLIDFDSDLYEEQVIKLTEPRGITRPLRLGPREAIALVASLQALAATPSLADDEAAVVHAVADKIIKATGQSASEVQIELTKDQSRDLDLVRSAITSGKRLRIRYVNVSDDVRDRTVDPLQVTMAEGHTYLLAWDVAADAERLFRADRILAVEMLDEPAERHPDVSPEIRLDDDAALVGIHLRPAARWVAETVPNVGVVEIADGTFQVWLRLADPSWLRQLLMRIAPEVIDVEPAHQAAPAQVAAEAALAAYAAAGLAATNGTATGSADSAGVATDGADPD